MGVWTGFIWLRIETSDGLLWIQQWSFGFHRTLGFYTWLRKLQASQGPNSMELISYKRPRVRQLDLSLCKYNAYFLKLGACGSAVVWGTMLQAGRPPVRVPDEVELFNLPNPSSRTMALGSTQPLTEMSVRNLPGVKSGQRVGLTTLPPSVCRLSENV
jgi:hypothetical protein